MVVPGDVRDGDQHHDDRVKDHRLLDHFKILVHDLPPVGPWTAAPAPSFAPILPQGGAGTIVLFAKIQEKARLARTAPALCAMAAGRPRRPGGPHKKIETSGEVSQTVKKVPSSRHVRMDGTHTGKLSAESVRGRKAECAVQRSILSPGTAKLRRVLRTKQPKRSRGSGLPFASPLRRAQQKQGTATTRGKEFLSPRMRAEMGSPWSVSLLRHAARLPGKSRRGLPFRPAAGPARRGLPPCGWPAKSGPRRPRARGRAAARRGWCSPSPPAGS